MQIQCSGRGAESSAHAHTVSAGHLARGSVFCMHANNGLSGGGPQSRGLLRNGLGGRFGEETQFGPPPLSTDGGEHLRSFLSRK